MNPQDMTFQELLNRIAMLEEMADTARVQGLYFAAACTTSATEPYREELERRLAADMAERLNG